jgi:hypothetical protein
MKYVVYEYISADFPPIIIEIYDSFEEAQAHVVANTLPDWVQFEVEGQTHWRLDKTRRAMNIARVMSVAQNRL